MLAPDKPDRADQPDPAFGRLVIPSFAPTPLPPSTTLPCCLAALLPCCLAALLPCWLRAKLPQVSAGLLVIRWLCAQKAHLLISYAIKQELCITLSDHVGHVYGCKLRHVSKEGAGDGDGNQGVNEDFADQIRVCADQGWKINIFIRYIAPFP
uniref:hypothetical protein n=1 Tax=Aeromonas hydrophila TaxID=644 RepID=UPI00107F6B38|nr:hypothetical protein [Aeromonas hydrophila]